MNNDQINNEMMRILNETHLNIGEAACCLNLGEPDLEKAIFWLRKESANRARLIELANAKKDADFIAHLNKCSAKVAGWPAWKRELIK